MRYPANGGKGTRTPGLLDAIETLYQLSYAPSTDESKYPPISPRSRCHCICITKVHIPARAPIRQSWLNNAAIDAYESRVILQIGITSAPTAGHLVVVPPGLSPCIDPNRGSDRHHASTRVMPKIFLRRPYCENPPSINTRAGCHAVSHYRTPRDLII